MRKQTQRNIVQKQVNEIDAEIEELKKIEFCYEPNEKEIELLNDFNYKYLQK